ncbi:Sensor kinase CusS [Actinomadura rubteroloni]|uniref:histidine kinase n=1 Tax=Actinomadura rubteroloni TaxID=1926885 RepID=A0A2P4UR27_9ACTN|nr:HAMP domain-containing sensor histidine kinase [Actinomadura rubteroloni]POM27502.1 Sensor kinase CusS [Actinomadura rubteroloni]
MRRPGGGGAARPAAAGNGPPQDASDNSDNSDNQEPAGRARRGRIMRLVPRWRQPPRIRLRVTLSAILITAVLTLAVYVLLLLLIRRQEVSSVDHELGQESSRLVAIVQGGLPDDGRILTGDSQELLQVIGPGGKIAAANEEMIGEPPVAFPPPGRGEERRLGTACGISAPGGRCFRVFVRRAVTAHGEFFAYALLPAPGLVPRPGEAAVLAIGIPLVTGLIGAGTWRAAGRTLRPVDEIRADLDEITASDLQRRVPVPPRDDEISRLAASVNATLDRLEAAVARQRGFVSDVSHELRSPLAGLRTELEVALADPDASDVRETLDATLRSADRLQAVVEDLLALARLDSSDRGPDEPVELHGLADQEVLRRPRRSRIIVPDGDPVTVRGSPRDLARLFTNLIDNADRHAASEVIVRIGTLPGSYAVVEVVDDGTGIAPEDRERIFERFTRLAEGQHRDAGGTGLGLAIARDIAAAHQGSLVLQDRADGQEGARFVLLLPMQAE